MASAAAGEPIASWKSSMLATSTISPTRFDVRRVDERTGRDAERAEHLSALRRREPVVDVVDLVEDHDGPHRGTSGEAGGAERVDDARRCGRLADHRDDR